MKKVYFYINDKFVLDNGNPQGCNIMLFGGDHDETYWFDEYRTTTVAEAQEYLVSYELGGKPVELLEKEITHPIPNRLYTPEELESYERDKSRKRREASS